MKKNRVFFRGKHLTPRQYLVLNLLRQGFNAKKIAEKLHNEESTVKTHLNNLYKIFNVNSAYELAVLYYRGKVGDREFVENADGSI